MLVYNENTIKFQQRHVSDSQVNNRRSKTLRNGKLIDEKWSGVQVCIYITYNNNICIQHFVIYQMWGKTISHLPFKNLYGYIVYNIHKHIYMDISMLYM